MRHQVNVAAPLALGHLRSVVQSNQRRPVCKILCVSSASDALRALFSRDLHGEADDGRAKKIQVRLVQHLLRRPVMAHPCKSPPLSAELHFFLTCHLRLRRKRRISNQ